MGRKRAVNETETISKKQKISKSEKSEKPEVEEREPESLGEKSPPSGGKEMTPFFRTGKLLYKLNVRRFLEGSRFLYKIWSINYFF